MTDDRNPDQHPHDVPAEVPADLPAGQAPAPQPPLMPEPQTFTHEPARSGRFAGLFSGGRKTIAAAVIALLLLVGAGSAGFALAAGGNDDNGNGDRSSQTRGGNDRDDDRDDGDVDEQPLTGATLAQVAEAVEVAYPGASIERAETDDDGVYEAHITTVDGDDLTVELDAAFAVTGIDD